MDRRLATHRIPQLSDGVIAIAMTLLALGIHVPDVTGTGHGPPPLEFLRKNLEHLELIAVTFFAVGFFWMIHHRMFRYIDQHDDTLLWLNMLFLLLVSLLPFTSEFAGEYSSSALALVLHYGLMAAMAGAQGAMWLHALRGRRFIAEGVEQHELHRVTVLTVGTGVVFLIAITLSSVNVTLARRFGLTLALVAPLSNWIIKAPGALDGEDG